MRSERREEKSIATNMFLVVPSPGALSLEAKVKVRSLKIISKEIEMFVVPSPGALSLESEP